jgi:serine/threonine-protein kinase
VDLAAVSAAVAAAADCGLVASASSADGVSVSGVVRRSEEATVMGMLNAFGGASATSRISLQPFDGPYCAALAAMRLDVAAPEAAPHLSLVSPNPLPNGQRLQFRVEVPVWASRLHVTYLTVSGDAGHLVNGAAVRPGETLIFNDPRWIATEPFGTDLLVAVASDRPLFAQKRRNVERQADYALALTAALRAVQEKGGRAAVRVIVVETAAH